MMKGVPRDCGDSLQSEAKKARLRLNAAAGWQLISPAIALNYYTEVQGKSSAGYEPCETIFCETDVVTE
jgi:hypothetical protein